MRRCGEGEGGLLQAGGGGEESRVVHWREGRLRVG